MFIYLPGHFFPELGFGLKDKSQQQPYGLFSLLSQSPRNFARAALSRSMNEYYD